MGGGRISSSTQPGNFLDFLRTSRKFPGNTVILPSPYRKRFPPWAYAKLPYRAWENCSGQCKGLFRAQKRKITMTSKENRNFCHSVSSIKSKYFPKKQKNSPLVLYFIQAMESWMPMSTMKSSGGWSIVRIMLQRSKKRKRRR